MKKKNLGKFSCFLCNTMCVSIFFFIIFALAVLYFTPPLIVHVAWWILACIALSFPPLLKVRRQSECPLSRPHPYLSSHSSPFLTPQRERERGHAVLLLISQPPWPHWPSVRRLLAGWQWMASPGEGGPVCLEGPESIIPAGWPRVESCPSWPGVEGERWPWTPYWGCCCCWSFPMPWGGRTWWARQGS